jgi:crossover junction endodeoxyribonuclease RuvC
MEGKTPQRILAIDPGTRHMGVAVLQGPELIFATVKIVRKKKMSPEETLKKTERILNRLIQDYQPDTLAVEQTFFVQSQQSPLLNSLTQKIARLGLKNRLQVYTYLPTTVRHCLCHNGKATKMNAAHTIVSRYYPWLYRYYEKDLKKKWWEEKYWANMFDAIALGLTCLNRAKPAPERVH